MLPAGKRADAPDRGVDDLKPGAVALAPDHPLMEGRRDLAALRGEPAVGVEHELRIVERAVIALVDAEHDHDAVALRRCRDRVGHRPRHHHGVFVEADMFGAGDDRRMDERKIRVPGHESLGENHELRALPGGFGDRGEHLRYSSAGRFKVRRDLYRGDTNQFLLRHRRFSLMPLFSAVALQRPRVEDERAIAPMQQDEIEHVERADRTNAGNERAFAVAVEHLQRKTAAINLAALAMNLVS